MTDYKRYMYPFLILTIFTVAGCGSKSTMESFLRDEVDMTYVTRVAVAPIENNSKEQFAPERVRGMAITEVLAQGLFDVVDKGLVDSAFREEAVDLSKAPMDAGVLKRLGQRLNVQAFLMGSIDHAGDVQRGQNSYPELGLTLRLVDVNSGMIFWQASGNESGNSLGKRLFGVGSDDEFKVSLRLLRRLLATISSERKVKLPTAVAATPAVVVPAEEVKSQEEAAPQEEAAQPAAQEEAAPMGEDEGLDMAPSQEEAATLPEEKSAGNAAAEPQEAPAAEASVEAEKELAGGQPSAPAAEEAEIKPEASSVPPVEQKIEQPVSQPAPSAPASASETAPSLQLDQAWPE